MVSVNIMLNSIKDVKDFVNIVNQYDFDVELVLGKYVIKPVGAPQLVPESDPRKPYSDAASDFSS